MIRYNPDKQFVDHMFIHEMMHLKMGQKETKANKGKVVVGTKSTKSAFYRRYLKYMKKALSNMPSTELDLFMNKLADSLNYQLMNCPLDLFVEHLIFSNYKQVRPLQLISLFHTEVDNINAAQKAFKDGYFPPEIAKALAARNKPPKGISFRFLCLPLPCRQVAHRLWQKIRSMQLNNARR